MYLCILTFPLLSYLFTNLGGRYIGIKGSCIIATMSIFLSFFFSVFAFYEVALNGSNCYITLGSWLRGELFLAPWGFYFDVCSTVMLLVVCSVSSLVHLYSTEYMDGDPHQGRFMGYLSLFTFFMLVLVTADNYLIMFLGWEGIGLASFLLISFWYTRIQAGKSAVKAMLVNRVGDLGLVLGISAIFLTFKSVDYPVVFALSPCAVGTTFSFLGFDLDRITVITFLLFWGALGKSAQLGLHIWLPDAMEGPTPVSALIHAATLVTAGVFLIIRSSFLFEHSPTTLFIVTCVGAMTAFFASSVGLVQNDLKRVIAYSTCSQLGYMVFACGLSHYSVAFFHLANHALFKALLFLSAGSIIHGLMDEQDLRRMGGLIRVFPLTYVMIFIGSIALMGFPFLTGFYSKDAILEVAVSRYSWMGNFAYILGCSAAFCTAFYSFRLVFLTFVNVPNSFKTYIEHAHEPGLQMLIPLFVLAFGSLFSGFMFKEMFVGLGTPFFEGSIFVNYTPTMLDGEFLHAFIKNIPLIFTIAGVSLSALFIHYGSFASEFSFSLFEIKMSNFVRTLYIFLSQKWNFDQVTTEFITHKLMCFGDNISFQLLDKGCIEQFGPLGISQFSLTAANQVSFMHSGLIFHYLFMFILGVIGMTLLFFGSFAQNLSIGLVLLTYVGFTKLL